MCTCLERNNAIPGAARLLCQGIMTIPYGSDVHLKVITGTAEWWAINVGGLRLGKRSYLLRTYPTDDQLNSTSTVTVTHSTYSTPSRRLLNLSSASIYTIHTYLIYNLPLTSFTRISVVVMYHLPTYLQYFLHLLPLTYPTVPKLIAIQATDTCMSRTDPRLRAPSSCIRAFPESHP